MYPEYKQLYSIYYVKEYNLNGNAFEQLIDRCVLQNDVVKYLRIKNFNF